MNRGTGCLTRSPTLAERAGSTFRSAKVRAGFIPTNHPEWDRFFGEAWDQNSTNACTGFGTAKAATMLARRAGSSVEFSAFQIYHDARKKRARLIGDDGAFISDAVWAFNHMGCSAENLWASHTLGPAEQLRRVNLLPSQAAYLNAKKNRRRYQIRMSRIVASGTRLAERVAHSLDAGQLVLVALPVGPEMRSGRRVIPKQHGDGLLHWLLVMEWRDRGTGIEFLLGNSWGEGWGNHGMQWGESSLIAQSRETYFMEPNRWEE